MEMYKNKRYIVYKYIQENPGLNADQILNALDYSIKNCGRLTELEKAGFVYSVKGQGNKNNYYPVENPPVFSVEAFKNDDVKKEHLPTEKIGKLVSLLKMLNLKEDISVAKKMVLTSKFDFLIKDYIMNKVSDDQLQVGINNLLSEIGASL